MKLSEVIAELEKNPNKKFVGNKDKHSTMQINVYDSCIVLEDEKRKEHFVIDLSRDWQEVKEPVTWQEAIQAWLDGKKIYCILGDETFEYTGTDILSDEDCFGVSKNEIVLGKWFIE